MNCNYRIYVDTKYGYQHIDVTRDEEKARNYLDNTNYEKVLIIRHDFERDCDEPYAMEFPNKAKVLKKKR